MEYTATQVQAMVRDMDHSKKRWRHLRLTDAEGYRARLKDENKVLFDMFPSLWEMHTEDKLDETFFKMLTLKRRIERGELTNEQASAMIGQQLFNRYVKPTVDASTPAPPPPMSYESFYRESTRDGDA
jgi:uncharacterized short protein YbdD (DUF466 family)